MIFRTVSGQGATVVFLHGFCETSEVWSGFLTDFGSDHRLICYDLPGFGNSRLLPSPFSIDDVALAVLDDLKLNSDAPVVVVGHSLGGYVALAMADLEPEMVRGFCLFHSSALADSAEKKKTRNKVAAFIDERGVRAFTDNFIPSLFYNPSPQIKDEIDDLIELAGRQSKEALIGYTLAMRDRPDRSHLISPAADIPALFIAGEKDEAVPMDITLKQTSGMQQNRLHVLKDTGHMGLIEKKEETRNIIRSFLSEID